jgi:PAS domain S-box-containing protein
MYSLRSDRLPEQGAAAMTAPPSFDEYALLVDQAPDGVIFADREGVVRVWNEAAERIFGFAESEAVGRRLDIIIPESLREAHWAGYERALAAGDTKYRGQSLPTKAVKADGSTIYVELSFAILHGHDGAVTGALATARDITERFERDRVMRRRLRELEGEAESKA